MDFIIDSSVLRNSTSSLWEQGYKQGRDLWPWLYTTFSLVLPGLLSIPLLYILSYLASLRKDSTLARSRRNLANFRKLAPFVLPIDDAARRSYRIDLAVVCLCTLFMRITTVLTPLLLRRIVDKLANPTTALPVADIVVFVLLRQVVNGAIHSLFWTKLVRVEADIANRLICELFDRAMALSADYHDASQPADLYNTITEGGNRFARFAMNIAFDKTTAIVDVVIGIFTFQRIFGSHLALTVAAIACVYIWASTSLIAQQTSPFATALKLRRQRDELGSDVLRHWHTVAAFNNISHEQSRYREATMSLREFRGKMFVEDQLETLQRNGVMTMGLMVLALQASADIKMAEGATTGRGVGDFVMLLQYWANLSYPIQNVVNWVSWFDEFFVESDKMIEILEAVPTVRDRKGAAEFKLKQGEIEFDKVGFSYDGKRQAVRDISFKVPGGTTVAIVGETGGGKSTLLRLLCRSYDVTTGSIRVDGQDLRDVCLGSLMKHVSIVPQIISVFNGTMEENLRYGKFTATREEYEAACEAAAFHKKISSFAKGYQEMVGEKGTKLSGGELQRLAIARALLRNSKIVLFDEAMSSLDSETEWKIQERLREFCANKTVVIIAHRLATIARADLILAVKDGVIVEAGRQQDLLEKKGYYYSLWDKQKLQ
ncbi:hypothetical protein N0V93_003098 [Gnomoniopsis smithogilvyi]|uniref:Uncharacterized protein n=1 Tax=Gnomoniopsis smithogilvyi TaxID=1191159 RepID=A0A9W9CZK1_9PEZI|nr:hypothetical protein N0V93_003098 [Gnomoniopsis smithogilvyi]